MHTGRALPLLHTSGARGGGGGVRGHSAGTRGGYNGGGGAGGVRGRGDGCVGGGLDETDGDCAEKQAKRKNMIKPKGKRVKDNR